MQSHVNDTGAEGGSAHRAGGPSVSPHNMPAEGGSKPKVQHRGSRSVDEYTRMQQIGEGQYGQVRRAFAAAAGGGGVGAATAFLRRAAPPPAIS